MQGEIADAAMKAGREIVLSYEKKGQYFNIKRGSLKMVEAPPAPAADDIEEVPF